MDALTVLHEKNNQWQEYHDKGEQSPQRASLGGEEQFHQSLHPFKENRAPTLGTLQEPLFALSGCPGSLAYLFQNQEGNDHA
jgi:hypothetical protein